jgi:hypothetical protein
VWGVRGEGGVMGGGAAEVGGGLFRSSSGGGVMPRAPQGRGSQRLAPRAPRASANPYIGPNNYVGPTRGSQVPPRRCAGRVSASAGRTGGGGERGTAAGCAVGGVTRTCAGNEAMRGVLSRACSRQSLSMLCCLFRTRITAYQIARAECGV